MSCRPINVTLEVNPSTTQKILLTLDKTCNANEQATWKMSFELRAGNLFTTVVKLDVEIDPENHPQAEATAATGLDISQAAQVKIATEIAEDPTSTDDEKRDAAQQIIAVRQTPLFPENRQAENQINSDPARLHQEIIGTDEAFEEMAPNVPVSNPAPTISPPLTELLALRLTVKTSDRGAVFGMATLIAPDLAITSYHVVSGRALDLALNVMVEFAASPSARIQAEVIRWSETADFALLKLPKPVPFPLPAVLLGTVPEIGVRWHSVFQSTQPPINTRVEGKLLAIATVSGTRYLKLSLFEPWRDPEKFFGFSGAPVVVDDHVVAIQAARQDGFLLALPISEIANTSEGAIIRSLMGLPPLEIHAEQSSDESKNEPILGPFSNQVLNIITSADQIRIKRNLPIIYTFDLLKALYEPGSLLSRLAVEAKIDFQSVLGPLPNPTPNTEGAEIDRDLPRVSGNVRRAFVLARVRADEEGSKTIEEWHLVFGVLSSSANQRIRILNEHGVTPEKAKQLAQKTITNHNPVETDQPAPVESAPIGSVAGFALAGYKSDDPFGKDLLDTQNEANALASVLAAKDV